MRHTTKTSFLHSLQINKLLHSETKGSDRVRGTLEHSGPIWSREMKFEPPHKEMKQDSLQFQIWMIPQREGPLARKFHSGTAAPPTHTHPSTINFTNSPTQRSIIYQDKREGSGQGSLPKAESVCGLVSYISGPVNQSVLNQLLQLHDCNWSSFLRDRLLRSRSGDKHRFSGLCAVALHLPLDKAP